MENYLLAGISANNPTITANLYKNLDSISPNSMSYQLNYRKSQLCLKYYKDISEENNRNKVYSQVKDDFPPVYYNINTPYVQMKQNVKNPHYEQGKHYYRRYVLPSQFYDKKEETFPKN